MSLIVSFLSPDFILFCGDQRMQMSGNNFSEEFRKVYYFNNEIIFGIVGSIRNNKKFLEEYLLDFNLLSDNKYRVNFEITKDIKFDELDRALTKKHNEWINTGNHKVKVIIGGYSEGKGKVKIFSIGGKYGDKIEEQIEEDNSLFQFVLGNELEHAILSELLNMMNSQEINDLQEIFQKLINCSSEINTTINKNMNAVFLRRYQI